MEHDANYKDLEDYGVIGNLKTIALVGRDGAIDWLCLPFLDSASVFATLLDAERGGRFAVTPALRFEASQHYVEWTNVLRTTFSTATGVASTTDFMPVADVAEGAPIDAIYRKIQGEEGWVEFDVELSPRFDYATVLPELARVDEGLRARAGAETLLLQSPLSLSIDGGTARAKLKIARGETLWLVLRYGQGARQPDEACEALLRRTVKYWEKWAHACDEPNCLPEALWHELAVRSGLALRLLANPKTGAIAAAGTTSLPEDVGGVRNWDYRYAWLRDSSLTIEALFRLNHFAELDAFIAWARAIIDRVDDPTKLRPMYGVHEDRDLTERTLDNLSGYRGSAPVRVGNSASGQLQLDIYGELVDAVYETSRHGRDLTEQSWRMVNRVVELVCEMWQREDAGIWEVRTVPRHFTHSKLMCWVALDRAIKMARLRRLSAPVQRWTQVRDQIRDAVLTHGYDQRRNTFVRAFGSQELDASTLLIPRMGLVDYDDPRVHGTIDAIKADLLDRHGLVHRYLADDGLPGREGTFLVCSFWLASCLAASGRVEEAEADLENIVRFASPLGLFAEEVDSRTGKMVGNFPQAFSHIGLINTVLVLGEAQAARR